MTKSFRPWKVDEVWLLPPSVQEFVPEGHAAHLVRDIVAEELDLSAILAAYTEPRGYPPYHPAMMVALLLYAYSRGVYSSRRIARACEERLDFQAVTALNRPDFRTISEFRRRHLAALAELFVQVLALCRRAGLVGLDHVAVDGTKLRANASKHKAMSYARMGPTEAELAVEVEGWLAQAEGADAAEDAVIAEELLGDEKERSEHVMLVDLGRNDLGRVCAYGSVRVDSFMAVETYSHVMHIVSNVEGLLRDGMSNLDVLKATFPAGTLTGAPKIRAMELIDELEPVKRGGYGGAIGYLSYTGDLDTCIHIRTVVIKDGMAHVQAGGGTVADARPDYEYEESVNKSRAVKGAIELAARHPEWP